VPLTFFLLWKTAIGLRLRSAGEYPQAAETLGVNVYAMKYIGVTISGMFAGLGGVFLVVEAGRIYREGQTAGRGYIGLATLIFGNWRPGGVALGAGLFGYADALQLRAESSVHAMLLFVAIAIALVGLRTGYRKQWGAATLMGAVALGFYLWYATTDEVPSQIVYFTPHLTTLLVLSFAARRLRMPAADGEEYRRGQVK
jgi:general nucleoside transport system permease protein